jgi:hypothetical protein
MVGKRLIDSVGRRLREIDPDRWEDVPVTFKTNWRDEGGIVALNQALAISEHASRFTMPSKESSELIYWTGTS